MDEEYLNYPDALLKCFDGEWITNDSWNGKGAFVYMDHMWITGQEENKTPFLAVKTLDGKLYPWAASQADVFSTKWKIVSKGD